MAYADRSDWYIINLILLIEVNGICMAHQVYVRERLNISSDRSEGHIAYMIEGRMLIGVMGICV